MLSVGSLVMGTGGRLVTPAVVNNGHLNLIARSGTTFSGAISGSGDVIFDTTVNQSVNGIIVLTGESTYSGGTTIGGNLQIGDGGTRGSIIGPVVLNYNSNLIFNRSNTVVFSGDITGSNGQITQAGSGLLILTGNNTVATTTINTNSRLQIGNGGTAGTLTSSVIVRGGAALIFNRSDTSTFTGYVQSQGRLEQIGSGTLIVTNAIVCEGGTTIASGSTLQVGDGGATGELFNNVTNNGTLIYNLSNDSTMSHTITGSGRVVQAGTGTTYLAKANTYTGGTIISAGTLQIGTSMSSGSIVGDVVDNGTFAFGGSGVYTFSGDISGTGGVLQRGSGTTILTGHLTYTGPNVVFDGILIIPSRTIFGGQTTAIIDDSFITPISFDPSFRGLARFQRSGSFTFADVLGNTASLEQVGTGTTILTGANTYTGSTTISAGTLQIGNGGTTGSLGSGAAMISSGATLVFNRSDTYAFANEVSGNGTLKQIGSGTLVITGHAGHIGGTTIGSGSTLQVGAGGTSGLLINDVTNDGTLVFNRSDTVVQSVTIHGSGAVVQAGSGTTILAGSNTYTGGTTISSGTLQIGNGGTSGSIVGNVVDNSTLAFNRSDTYTFAGDISGTGGILQFGSGTTILTGHLTYTGPTVVTNGVLITPAFVFAAGNGVVTVDNSFNLPVMNNQSFSGTFQFSRTDTYTYAGSLTGPGNIRQIGSGTTIFIGDHTYTGGTTITAGTLQLGNGGTTGSVAGNIVDNAALAFNRSNTVAFSGAISGTGRLTQAGTGTLILNGNNTFTGGTTVSSGRLIVGDDQHHAASLAGNVTVASGTTLGGHGTIAGSVSNGGTVAPGASIGVLTVGSYIQGPGGTLSMEVTPISSDQLIANGPVSLDGTLSLAYGSGTYGTHQYTLVQTSGQVAGHFAGITTNRLPNGVAYSVLYDTRSVSLITEPVNSGQLYSDLGKYTFDVAEAIGDQINAHQSTRNCHGEGKTGRAGEWSCPELSVWYQAFGGVGSFDGSGASTGFNSRFAGLVGGFDVDIEDGFAVGLTGAYARGKLNVGGGGANVATDTFAFGVTADLPLFDGLLDTHGLWTSTSGDARRNVVPFEAAAQWATSHPKSNTYGASVQYSHPIAYEDLSGLARLTYTASDMPAFGETGAAPYNFGVTPAGGSSFYGDVGLRFSHIYHLRSGATLVPQITVAGRGYFVSASQSTTVNLVGGMGSSLEAPAVASDRYAVVAGLNVTAQRRDGFGVALHAQGRISSHMREGVLGLEGRYPF